MREYHFDAFTLDIQGLLLLHLGKPVALGPKVVETLLALIEHPGEVIAKSAVMERVWPEGYVEEANLAQNIYVLRKTLRELAGLDAIETVPRRGYRFTTAVTLVERVAEEPVHEAAREIAVPRQRRAWPAFAGIAASLCLVALLLGVAFASSHRAAPLGLSAAGERDYQLGEYYWNLRTRPGIERSLTYFGAVAASDPRDARGYAGLADANAMMGDYRYGTLGPREYFKRSREFAHRALALDPNSAEAHAALGLIALDSHKSADAITELQRSIALDPQYGPAREWYGVALVMRGDLPHAFAQLRLAADLDPLSVAASEWFGSAAYLDRHFNEAISYSREALDLSPQRTEVWTTIGEAYEAEGNYSRAADAFNRYGTSCAACRAEAAALLAHTYALQHLMPQARAQLAFARAHARDVDQTDLAVASAAVGDRNDAFTLLRHLRGHLVWIAIQNDPRFDALRADASFRQLAQSQA